MANETIINNIKVHFTEDAEKFGLRIVFSDERCTKSYIIDHAPRLSEDGVMIRFLGGRPILLL